MNLENVKKLHDWLMAGAPHAVFDMSVALFNGSASKDRHWYYHKLLDPKADTVCGTVCCIAGAAAWLRDGCPPPSEQESTVPNWDAVEEAAMTWLGLEPVDYWIEDCPDEYIEGDLGHPLFDNHAAPPDTTPQQAAAALMRVAHGQEPWPEQFAKGVYRYTAPDAEEVAA